MTIRQARQALDDLEAPALAEVLAEARRSHATVLGLALALALDDGELTAEEAFGLAALAYLLAEVEREGRRLADVTERIALTASPAAYREGVRQAGRIAQDRGLPHQLPYVSDPAIWRQVAPLLAPLAFYAGDAVAAIRQQVARLIGETGLRRAVTTAIDRTFGADPGGTMGTMTRRSLTTAGQAVVEVYRDGMIDTYREVAPAGWWVWRARLDRRCCAACVALHGRTFPVSRPFDRAHVGCRCLPELVASRSATGETGAAWLAQQPEAVQRSILGVRGAEQFRAGTVELRDFLRLERHPVYGPQYRDGGIGWAERRASRRAAAAV